MISVVIPTYNKPKFLDMTLGSLSRQIFEKEETLEVIVANSGEKAESGKVIDFWSKRMNIKYLPIENASGRAFTRNFGAKSASGDILIFLDDDMVCMPHLVQAHIDAHKKSDNLLVLGYRYRLEQPLTEFFNYVNGAKAAENLHHIALLPSVLDERDEVYKMCNDDIEDYYAPWALLFSNNFSVRKKHLEDFDDIFQRKWGIEDVELGLRYYKKGLKYVLARKAEAYHLLHTASWKRNLNDLKDNLELFYKKFPTYEVEMYVVHLNVSLRTYMKCIRTIKLTDKFEIKDKKLKELTADFYEKNIKKDDSIFISGMEDKDNIAAVMKITDSVIYSDVKAGLKDLGKNCTRLIGVKTEYKDNQFNSVIIGQLTAGTVNKFMPILIREAYRVGKNVLFALTVQDLKTLLFEFFSIEDSIDYRQELIELLEFQGMSRSEMHIEEKDSVFFVKLAKNDSRERKSRDINIEFSIDMDHPHERTISALEFAFALIRQGVNIQAQNLKKFMKYIDFDISKKYVDIEGLTEDEKNMVKKMLKNDLKLYTDSYLELPVEVYENFTPRLLGRSDGAGFPLTEAMQLTNAEMELTFHSSEFTKENFKKVGGDPNLSYVVPMGVSPDIYVPLKNKTKNNKFTFIAMGTPMKDGGFDDILEAFSSVFTKNDNVALRIYFECLQEPYQRGFFHRDTSYDSYRKTYELNKMIYYSKMSRYKEKYENGELDIKIDIANLNSRKNVKLFQECDCFISMYRNDFSGLSLLKAMSCEKPVITMDRFLPENMCTPDNSYTVDSTFVAGYEHEYYYYSEYMLWIRPVIEELKKKLREVFENQNEAEKKGLRARKGVLDKWTWDYSAKKAVESILDSYAKNKK